MDTLIELREQLGPNAHICWVMGTDAAANISKWHDWQRLFHLANVIVMARSGEPDLKLEWPATFMDDVNTFKEQAHGCYTTVKLPQVLLSSSQIRKAVEQWPISG